MGLWNRSTSRSMDWTHIGDHDYEIFKQPTQDDKPAVRRWINSDLNHLITENEEYKTIDWYNVGILLK